MRISAGMLVRYGSGETALMMIESPHAGGWHGHQCMGGHTFVCDKPFSQLTMATAIDWKIWNRCAKWRSEEVYATDELLNDGRHYATNAIKEASQQIWESMCIYGKP